MTGSRTFVVAVSGASGVIYGVRLISALLNRRMKVATVLSDAGVKVLTHEMGYDAEAGFPSFLKANGVDPILLKHLSVFPRMRSQPHRHLDRFVRTVWWWFPVL